MSERSIAELMGWRLYGGYGCEAWYWDADGKQRTTPVDGPTPDDMLAWLHGRNLQFSMMSFADRTGVSWGVSEWAEPPAVGNEVTDGHAPALHAALEAAVRAVAEVTP